MKIIVSFVLALTGIFSATAQKVEIKKDIVYFNENAILKYDKINAGEISFYSLSGDETLYYRYFPGRPGVNPVPEYFALNFVSSHIKIETTDLGRIASLGIKNAMEKLIAWLVKEKVICADGSVDLLRLNAFYEKYNEMIPNK